MDAGIIFGRDGERGGTWLGYNKRLGVYAALTNVRDHTSSASPSPTSRGHLVLSVLRRDALAAPTLYELRQACDAGTAARIADGSVRGPNSGLRHGEGVVDLRADYAGFNMVIADLSGPQPECFFVTNRPVRHGPVANGTAASSSSVASGPNETADVAVAPDYYAVPASGDPAAATLPRHAAVVQRVGAGVHVLSNSTLNDASWAKVRWVREQLTDVAAGVPFLA